jgi:hypothetical protein
MYVCGVEPNHTVKLTLVLGKKGNSVTIKKAED